MGLGKVKKIVIKTIGYSNYRRLLTSVMRMITKVDSDIMYGNHISELKEYSVKGKNAFFGYYDLVSLSDDGEKLLSIVVDEKLADVGYFDVNSGVFHKVTDTRAWNWQMGARMRWYESGRSILFNDYDGCSFISRVVDINGNEIERFPYPIFDVDMTSKNAYFCDFTILHHLRKGYGYSNLSINFEDYYKSTENGLFKFNLDDKKKKSIISLQELKKIEPTEDMDNKYHYINHITVNPSNGDVMFFHIWTDNKGTWKNRMVFVDQLGKLIRIISDFDRASHYDWKDENSILVSIYVNGKVEYRLYDYRTGKYDLLDGMKTDGHPTYVDKRFFITDTYPNRCAMQSIYMCDSKEHTYKNLFSVYHQPCKTGDERCDLHPRISGNIINIDSVKENFRSQFLMKYNIDFRNTTQWDRNLLLDKQASIEVSEPKSSSLFSCMNSEYCFTTGRQKSNKLKVLKMFLEGPTFRANVYVAQMQKTTSIRKKRKLKNKLEFKHGMVVYPNAKIGKHFRADHTVGIVIGSGVVIGDHCKIYQNVTLGRKSGRFPIVGNYVTIFPGAKIIGDVKIGDYAVIGANAVVTKDVPEGAVAVGVPAHNIIS